MSEITRKTCADSETPLDLEETFPDLVQGVFNSVEERWEAGSHGMMRLMEFSLEFLRLALKQGHRNELEDFVKSVNMSSAFVRTGADLMLTFGNISRDEYDKFRDRRDIHGSTTDKRIIDLHVMQRELMKDLLRFFFYTLSVNEIDTDSPIEEIAKSIRKNSTVLSITEAMVEANEAHKRVFSVHKFVCRQVVRKGEPSLRNNYIEMFQNRDFAALLPLLKEALTNQV
jgi:hypothetical protein